MLTIESTTAEKLPITIKTAGDPTATDPSFAVTTGATEPTTWVTGEWSGTWSNETQLVEALTPVAGNGQALDLDPGVEYDLWGRWTLGAETPVRHIARLRIT